MTTVQQLAASNEPKQPSVVCRYCGNLSELVDGQVVYPSRADLWRNKLWYCAPCQAWVGCHPGTERPLGILANATLRKLKQRVHALFDPMWARRYQMKGGQPFTKRSQGYAWLAQLLEIEPAECHVGMFDEERCLKAIFMLRAEWSLRGWALPQVERE